MKVQFDHIEVHVEDIKRYCDYLAQLFEGGSYEVISTTGTSMYISPEGIRIEVKKKKTNELSISSGFCNPCLRRQQAKSFLARLGLSVEYVRESPGGQVYFFRDHENILWHMKDVLKAC